MVTHPAVTEAKLPTAAQLGIDPRFAVEAEIGQGAGSRVFRVADQARGVKRALKLALRRGRTRAFRSEFRRLAEFRHPNIVRSYGYGLSAKRLPYYTLELVRGVHLAALEERWDAEVLALIAMQVLDALATIHARGWVHRDIKPSNLLIVGRGAGVLLRLIDLGLLVAVGSRGAAAGTLPYMAPEVARGEAVDGRADLYSLGMVLYEALLPEEAPGTVVEVSRQFTERLTPPNDINPAIPAGLSDFIMTLLAPMPEDRYSDAEAAAAHLAKVPDLHVGRGPALAICERLLRGGAVAHRPGLLRKIERWATEAVESGRGGTCIIGGERGLGKTPLLREASTSLSLKGIRVLRLRATKHPGSPIPALLQAARALRPEAVHLPDPGPMPLGSGAVAEEIAGFTGRLGRSLARAFGDRPTVVILDDLHKAEIVSLEVLRSLGHELRATPLLLLCGGDPRADGVDLAEALGADVTRLQLAPLTKGEIARLASHRLVGLTLPPPALNRLARDSQGMPSLVERTLARLVADRTILRQQEGFTFVGGRYRAASHGDEEGVAARLAHVPPPIRPLLAAAAVLDRGINARTLAAVADVEVEVAAGAIAELAQLRILNAGEATQDPTYLFASRALRTTVYDDIPTQERRRFHDRAAAVVAHRQTQLGRRDDRTEHLLRGSDDRTAILAALEAGDRAASIYADRQAIEYHARAYARLSGPEDRRAAGIALRLGRLFARGGELERATVWYRVAMNAAKSCGEAEPLIEALLGLGTVALTQGIAGEAADYTRRVLAALTPETDPRLRAHALRLEALVAHQSGDTARAEELLLAAREALVAAKDERPVIRVLLDLARVARQRGELVSSVRYARRALLLARRVGEPSTTAEALALVGRGFLRASRFTAARRALSQALYVSRQAGDRLREATVLREIGNLRTRQADFAGALERYNRGLELARAVRARADESSCLHNIGVVTTLLGRFRAALSALRAALEVAESIGNQHGGLVTRVELGHTWAGLGALERAAAILSDAGEEAEASGSTVLASEANAILAWVELRQGRPERAERVVAEIFETVARLEDPAARAHRLLYAGRSALRAGQRQRAQEIAERLRAEVQAGVLVDFEAAALGMFGCAAARGEEMAAGIEALERAVQLAREQGMRPLEVPLRYELGRLLAGSDAGVEHLTRAMELVRELVAELPPHLAAFYLNAAESQSLRQRFREEHDRVRNLATG